MSDRGVRRYSALAAGLWVIFSPLLATAYFATADGAESLEIGSVRAWSDPARNLAGGLLTFASADRVYATYTLVIAVLFPSVLLAARTIRRGRPDTITRAERISWRVVLGAYGVFAGGLVVAALSLIPDPSGDNPVLDPVFMIAMLPGLIIGAGASTALGISLLRGGFAPTAAAWLLALAFPLQIAASALLGHNSLGLFPLVLAWAIATRSAECASLQE